MARVIESDPSAVASSGTLLARFAIWANDPDRAERWTAMSWSYVPHGGAAEADHLALLASVQGLRGDRGAAERDYREAARRYRDLRLDLDEGYIAIDMVYVLGPSHPLTVECVARARSVFAANRARTFLDQLDIAIEHGPHTAAAPGGARTARKAAVPAS